MTTAGQMYFRVGDKFRNVFWCDRLSCGPTREGSSARPVAAFSVIGPQIQIKALFAAFASNVRIDMEAHSIPLTLPKGDVIDHAVTKLQAMEAGYRLWRYKLPQKQAQLVAIVKDPGMIVAMDDESLWVKLTERYTTPMIRAWAPIIQAELEDRKLLRRLANFQCNCGVIGADEEAMAKLVSDLVTAKRLTIN